jgi:ABC-type xylose transport system permease subunit
MSQVTTENGTGLRARVSEWRRVTEYVIVVAIVIESIVFAAIAPEFFSVPNLVNIALSIAITGILAGRGCGRDDGFGHTRFAGRARRRDGRRNF